jgi:hypothetical protein
VAGGHPGAGAPAGRLMTSEAVNSSSIGSTQHLALMHSSNTSRLARGKQCEAVEVAAWSTGAPLLISLADLLRCHQRHRGISPVPLSTLCGPIRAQWTAVGCVLEASGLSPQAERRGRMPPFATVVVVDLGRLQSLARWWKPWQRRQCCGNRQVATQCE